MLKREYYDPYDKPGHAEIFLKKSSWTNKNWSRKTWKQTKKFVKKHKKTIIIGAAVVVITIVIIYTAGAAAAAGALAPGAGAVGAVAASELDNEEEYIEEHVYEEPLATPPPTTSTEALSTLNTLDESPILRATLNEHISIFKEAVVEETFSEITEYEEPSFKEVVRHLAATAAHQTLDGIYELAACGPQLLEEIKEAGHRFLPESMLTNGPEITPMENYQNSKASAHESIDKALSTDQATLYTAEARQAHDEMTIVGLPPPGLFNGTSINASKLAEAGKTLD